MHRKLIPLIVEGENKGNMECLEHIMIEAIDNLKLIDYELYQRIEHKLYKMVYGHHLSKELACEWVASMKNKDGTVGEHWSFEETSKIAGNHNLNDWYAILNMVYSDYYNSKYGLDDYVSFANDFIGDKDGKESKVLDYYLYVVCGK